MEEEEEQDSQETTHKPLALMRACMRQRHLIPQNRIEEIPFKRPHTQYKKRESSANSKT